MSLRKNGSLAVERPRLNFWKNEEAAFLVRLVRAFSSAAAGFAIKSPNSFPAFGLPMMPPFSSLIIIIFVLVVRLCCPFFLLKGQDAEISISVGGESVREP